MTAGAWDGQGFHGETVQTDRTLFSTTFEFPWTKAPLSLNYRMHPMQEAKIVRQLRTDMHAMARHMPDLDRCEVTLVWVVAPALKALCDGLVDAEVVPDDTHVFMVKNMPIIRYESGATPHFELHVRELPAASA